MQATWEKKARTLSIHSTLVIIVIIVIIAVVVVVIVNIFRVRHSQLSSHIYVFLSEKTNPFHAILVGLKEKTEREAVSNLLSQPHKSVQSFMPLKLLSSKLLNLSYRIHWTLLACATTHRCVPIQVITALLSGCLHVAHGIILGSSSGFIWVIQSIRFCHVCCLSSSWITLHLFPLIAVWSDFPTF